jgi:hypothetical protein
MKTAKHKPKHIHEDHEEHPDERWLVSYADMMTLLFGLFVMLYAMRSPEQTQKFKESIQGTFDTKSNNPPPPLTKNNAEDLQKLNADNSQLKEEISRANANRIAAETKFLNLNKQQQQIMAEKEKLAQEKNQLQQELDLQLKKITQIQKSSPIKNSPTPSFQQMTSKNEQLESKNQELITKLALLEKPLKEKVAHLENVLQEKESLLKKIEKQAQTTQQTQSRQVAAETETKDQLAQNQKKLEEVLEENQKLEKEINQLKAQSQDRVHFLAAVLTWSTNEHDLDLSVTDPAGRVFNFKKRKYSGQPGAFTLDTRRGPGTEVWQSAKVLPGKYVINIEFYNKYSNDEPAAGKVTMFTSYGQIDTPEFKLTGENRNKRFIFNVDENGKILK